MHRNRKSIYNVVAPYSFIRASVTLFGNATDIVIFESDKFFNVCEYLLKYFAFGELQDLHVDFNNAPAKFFIVIPSLSMDLCLHVEEVCNIASSTVTLNFNYIIEKVFPSQSILGVVRFDNHIRRESLFISDSNILLRPRFRLNINF